MRVCGALLGGRRQERVYGDGRRRKRRRRMRKERRSVSCTTSPYLLVTSRSLFPGGRSSRTEADLCLEAPLHQQTWEPAAPCVCVYLWLQRGWRSCAGRLHLLSPSSLFPPASLHSLTRSLSPPPDSLYSHQRHPTPPPHSQLRPPPLLLPVQPRPLSRSVVAADSETEFTPCTC